MKCHFNRITGQQVNKTNFTVRRYSAKLACEGCAPKGELFSTGRQQKYEILTSHHKYSLLIYCPKDCWCVIKETWNKVKEETTSIDQWKTNWRRTVRRWTFVTTHFLVLSKRMWWCVNVTLSQKCEFCANIKHIEHNWFYRADFF